MCADRAVLVSARSEEVVRSSCEGNEIRRLDWGQDFVGWAYREQGKGHFAFKHGSRPWSCNVDKIKNPDWKALYGKEEDESQLLSS